MALLANGLETLEIGCVTWREILNADLVKLDQRTIVSGSLAARPAAGATPRFYYATDTGQLFHDTGTAWVLVGKDPSLLTIGSQTGDYTLVLADAGKYIRVSSASAASVTVPAASQAAFQVGTQIHLRQAGAGQLTITADAGVTIHTAETLKLRKQGSTASLIKVAADIWDLTGDLEPLS